MRKRYAINLTFGATRELSNQETGFILDRVQAAFYKAGEILAEADPANPVQVEVKESE